MNDLEIQQAEQELKKNAAIALQKHVDAEKALHTATVSQQRLHLLREKLEAGRRLEKIQSTLQELDTDKGVYGGQIGVYVDNRPHLVLPKLLADHSDVDASSRDHLEPQATQIVEIFKVLTSPGVPYVRSREIRNYILENFQIDHPDYWLVRTSPKEPPRWWKNIYDKAIERLDLSLNVLVRSSCTGKRGIYALREYVFPSQPLLFQTSPSFFKHL
jgi:hypothetical protein